MKENTSIYLEDILDAIDKIETYIKDYTFALFIKDDKTQYAVRTCFMIIGEAVKRVSFEFKENNPQIPWKKIAGMRDILIHEYEGIRLDTVWETIHTVLPPFKIQIQSLLNTTTQ